MRADELFWIRLPRPLRAQIVFNLAADLAPGFTGGVSRLRQLGIRELAVPRRCTRSLRQLLERGDRTVRRLGIVNERIDLSPGDPAGAPLLIDLGDGLVNDGLITRVVRYAPAQLGNGRPCCVVRERRALASVAKLAFDGVLDVRPSLAGV